MRYAISGSDPPNDEVNEENQQYELVATSKHFGSNMSLEAHLEFLASLRGDGTPISERTFEEENLVRADELGVRSYWAGIPNMILELADEMVSEHGPHMTGDPLLVADWPTPNAVKEGEQQQAAAPQNLHEYLQRSFDLFKVGEIVRKRCGGLSGIPTKGLMNLEEAVENRIVKLGREALRDLLGDHPIVCVDTGVVNELALAIVIASLDENNKVSAHATKYFFKTATRYAESGVDAVIDEANEENKEYELVAMSEHSGSTMDYEEYNDFLNTVKEKGTPILDRNFDEKHLKRKHELANRVRSFWAGIPNMILALVDEMVSRYGPHMKGAPLLVFGKPTFEAAKKGKRAAAPKKLLEYLQRFFAIVTVGEYNTSKLCPCCAKEMERFNTCGYRLWTCKHGCMGQEGTKAEGKPLVVNKDYSAAINFFKIMSHLIVTGSRPEAFQPTQTTAPSSPGS